MNRILTILTISVFCCITHCHAQKKDFTPSYKYRITLKDKKGSNYSLRHPEQFLSQKSIERRKRQHLKLDKTDLPVSPVYLQQIAATGLHICSTSKWNNTVLVETTDTTLAQSLLRKSFVTALRRVATYTKPAERDTTDRIALISEDPAVTKSKISNIFEDFFCAKHPEGNTGEVDSIAIATAYIQEFIGMNDDEGKTEETTYDTDSVYGHGFTQIDLLHGQHLHQQGFRGQGMTIAIIDGGFYNADIIPMLQTAKILGTRDFAESGTDIYAEESHGMMVLSCMAANTPGCFVGTAPEASFWLLRSEDGYSEQMVEEDNWAAAIEFADSIGADLVNTSLGYSKYDNADDNVRYHEMDGHQRLCSHSASLMARKGMVLCNSAGNEASKPWKLISIPADADDVLTVGAVNAEGINTNFSSLGNTADGRIKPDVMAMGQDCTVLSRRGKLTTANGTSFASPILCGMVACYWQAHPQLTALQVMEAVRRMGNNVEHPDNVFGYGIPDFSK